MKCECEWTRSKRRDDPKKSWVRRKYKINCIVHNTSNISNSE